MPDNSTSTNNHKVFNSLRMIDMKKRSRTYRKRRRFYEKDAYKWDIRRISKFLDVEGELFPHPSRESAVFVVHGIGEQAWKSTSATLRSGFEELAFTIHQAPVEFDVDVAPDLATLRKKKIAALAQEGFPPPFVAEGFWADYEDIERFFPEDWTTFNDRERIFFTDVWNLRLHSRGRILLWFMKQQLKLLSPRIRKDSYWTWILYFPLQIVALSSLLFAWLRHPILLTGYLQDIRLYLDPRGLVEHAIVQRIDQRVGESFLRMIGLDSEFRPLPAIKLMDVSGEKLEFKRVVWVAHSLGSVISYNVLSDLFDKAAELSEKGDRYQKGGVNRFRDRLCRFVTIGSPIDKVALIFDLHEKDPSKQILRPWPVGSDNKPIQRSELLKSGEGVEGRGHSDDREWWFNFYHILDPISGALANERLFGSNPPANFHTGLFRIPIWAHTSYWRDKKVLRYIVGRTYGVDYLPDFKLIAYSPKTLTLIGLVGYAIWFFLVTGAAVGIIYWLYRFGIPRVLEWLPI